MVEVSRELVVVCPFCRSITQSGKQKPKCYVNPEKNVYQCFHCQASGRAEDLPLDDLEIESTQERKAFDPIVFGESFNKHDVLTTYIQKRFNIDSILSEKLIEKTRIRVHQNLDKISIPVFGTANQLVGIKYRYIDPNAFSRYDSEPGSKMPGFWIKQDDNYLKKVLLVEGEFDAMACWLGGFNGDIVATQTTSISSELHQQLLKYQSVFCWFDDDKAGQEFTTKFLQTYPNAVSITHQMRDELLPSKDPNECLLSSSLSSFTQKLQTQTQIELEQNTYSYSKSLSKAVSSFVMDAEKSQGYSTGYQAIDSLLGGGYRASEMTILNSFAGVGKSSLVNNLIHRLIEKNEQAALISFEMEPVKSIYPSLISIAAAKDLFTIPRHLRGEFIDEVYLAAPYIQNVTIYNRFGTTLWPEIETWIQYVISKHKIKYLFLDHAGFMVNKMTDAEENQQLAKNIKKAAMKHGIHIVVVVQSPKLKENIRGLGIDTAYGGMAWAQNCDNFFTLERDKENTNCLNVKLIKARFPGAKQTDEAVKLSYDPSSRILSE